jgi:ubiquitin-conjugating enzyme E2 Q
VFHLPLGICVGIDSVDGRGINSVVFEIRFLPSFPLSPPFFRIIKPRFLPFIRGGGGHVTGGE